MLGPRRGCRHTMTDQSDDFFDPVRRPLASETGYMLAPNPLANLPEWKLRETDDGPVFDGPRGAECALAQPGASGMPRLVITNEDGTQADIEVAAVRAYVDMLAQKSPSRDEQLGTALRFIALKVSPNKRGFEWYVNMLLRTADAMRRGWSPKPVKRSRVLVDPPDQIDMLLELLCEMVTGAPCGVTGFPDCEDLSEAEFIQCIARYKVRSGDLAVESDRVAELEAEIARLRTRADRAPVLAEDCKGVTVEAMQVLVERAGLVRIRETMTWETGKYGARVNLNHGLDRAINDLASITCESPWKVLDDALAESE
jgi:hypothetical protein